MAEKHKAEIDAVHKAVDELIAAIAADQQVDDEELQIINDLMEHMDQKITDLLAAHGFEVGDERID